MPYKDIQKRLEEHFSTPLSDFYDRRIIFWKDEDQEFESVFDELELDGVSKIKLNGSNAFEVKKLLSAADLTGNYLVYSPISYADYYYIEALIRLKNLIEDKAVI